MAITIESLGTQGTATTGTTLGVPYPSGIQSGDLLVAHVVVQADDAISVPGSFTQIQQVNHVDIGSVSIVVAYKVADGTETGSINFGIANNNDATGRMFRISGQDDVSPIGASSTGQNSGSVTVTMSTITPARQDSLIMMFTGADTDGTARTASGYALTTDDITWAEQYDEQPSGNEIHAACATGLRVETSATGNATATLSGGEPNVGVLVAITPDEINVNPTVTPLTISSTLPNASVAGDANVTVTPLITTSTIPNATINTSDSIWTEQSESSAPTWTEQTEN